MKTSNSYDSNNKKDIIFKARPIIDETGIGIDLEANSHITIGNYNVNKDCEYFKIVCGLDTEDETLTSAGFGSVCIEFIITYLDSENEQLKTITDTFFPKYYHENNNEDDSTIISAPGKVKKIKVNAYNNESSDVTITALEVFVAIKADVTPETVGENLSEYYNNGGQTTLVIPLVDELPDVNSVPDGYICRLSTMG